VLAPQKIGQPFDVNDYDCLVHEYVTVKSSPFTITVPIDHGPKAQAAIDSVFDRFYREAEMPRPEELGHTN
jgi:hypothetical protein